jgi:hypothetical protein
MSTQIVDNFKLNVAKPIDSRMVTSGTASRNSLAYIYEGLRVYDIVNKAPFVYINGSWQQEGSAADGGGSGGGGSGASIPPGTTNRLLKYTTSTTMGDSSIFDKSLIFTNPNVGIGKSPTIGIALDINGILQANVLKGNINGIYVDNASIDSIKIVPGASGDILKTINGQVVWSSSNPLNIDIVVANEVSSANTHYLLFSSISNSSTGTPIYTNSYNTLRLIGIKPSTSQILASGDTSNNEAQPTYAFSGTTNAGLYGSATEVGLSFAGRGLLKLTSASLSIYDTSGNSVLSTGTNKVTFKAGEFTKLDVSGVATVNSLIINGTTTFGGTIDTTTLNVAGTATVLNLTVTGTTTFTSVSTSTLDVSNKVEVVDLVATGTATLSSLTLDTTLDVTGTTNLAALNVSGITTFYAPIQGPTNVTDLTILGTIKIGSSLPSAYYIASNGAAVFQSLNVSDSDGYTNNNSGSGVITCNKIHINPTTQQVPTQWNTQGYSTGDIIFVLDTGSTTDGTFYFNNGPNKVGGGWVKIAY